MTILLVLPVLSHVARCQAAMPWKCEAVPDPKICSPSLREGISLISLSLLGRD